MRVEDLTVEVRDENLNRVGQILPEDLVGFKAVVRFNNVGTWEIDLPAGHLMAEFLRLPGYGIIVTGPDGVIISGPTTSAQNEKERGNPEGTWRISGVDDSVILGERLAYPTPSTSDVSAQTSAYDTVNNVTASTAMYGYVERNLVAGTAATDRAVPFLTLAADTSVGSPVTKSARFNVLGELLSELAIVDGIGFQIKQQDDELVFSVYEPLDRSSYIRMDVANDTLSKTSYGYAVPGVTKAIVAGQGQAESRVFIEVTNSDATSAQNLWKRRIENFIDQRNTEDTDELNQAGLERLAESGKTITSIDVVPNSDDTMRPFYDWNIGDKVGVVVSDQEVSAIVTQIAISIESDGLRIGATVGEPTGVDYEALVAKRQQTDARAIKALERKESGSGGGGASIIISDSEPTEAPDDAMWFYSNDGSAFVKYNDGDSSQWVEVKNPNDAGARVEELISTVSQLQQQVIPPGSITQYAGSSAPSGYLLCNGSAVSRIAYGSLFAIIGTSYGTGDGSTTFNVPNLRGRVAVGFDDAQGEFNSLGKTGGSKTHTLTESEMPSHRHSVGVTGADDNNHTGNGDYVSDSDAGYRTQRNTTYTGGNQPHNNLQPYVVTNYIIKT